MTHSNPKFENLIENALLHRSFYVISFVFNRVDTKRKDRNSSDVRKDQGDITTANAYSINEHILRKECAHNFVVVQ